MSCEEPGLASTWMKRFGYLASNLTAGIAQEFGDTTLLSGKLSERCFNRLTTSVVSFIEGSTMMQFGLPEMLVELP